MVLVFMRREWKDIDIKFLMFGFIGLFRMLNVLVRVLKVLLV